MIPSNDRLKVLVIVATLSSQAAVGGCGGRPSYPTRDGAADSPVETGSIAIDGGFGLCNTVLIQASPTSARVGQTVAVSGRLDSASAGVPAFAWSAPSGTFGDSKASSTTFECQQPGSVTVTLSVTDGGCVNTATVSIFCLAIPDAGAGGSGGGSTGGTGGSDGTGGSGATGGGMVVADTCPDHEPGTPTADCETCTKANVPLSADGDSGCCVLADPADRALCEAAVVCFTNPPGGMPNPCTLAGDATNCFCGNSDAACFTTAGAANGPCVMQARAAAKTTTPSAIQLQFNSPTSPLGRAANLVFYRGQFCPVECGVD